MKLVSPASFSTYFRLFYNAIQCSWKCLKKSCRSWGSNHGSLILEATALPTVAHLHGPHKLRLHKSINIPGGLYLVFIKFILLVHSGSERTDHRARLGRLLVRRVGDGAVNLCPSASPTHQRKSALVDRTDFIVKRTISVAQTRGQFHESKVMRNSTRSNFTLYFIWNFPPFFFLGVNSAQLQSSSFLKTW